MSPRLSVSTIATCIPLGVASQALTTAWFEGGIPALQLLVLAGYVVVLYPLEAKLLRMDLTHGDRSGAREGAGGPGWNVPPRVWQNDPLYP